MHRTKTVRYFKYFLPRILIPTGGRGVPGLLLLVPLYSFTFIMQ
jgi:hypothetical protein